MTSQERVLTHLLSCGIADLRKLDDINYNIDEIIDELQECGNLSLHGIFENVFKRAGEDLAEALKKQKDDIKSRIEYELEQEQKNFVETGDITKEELEECDEYISLVEDLELLTSGNLQPTNNITYYLNCLDTHVYCEHLDFYKRWMDDVIDDIEYNMGFYFQ